jgi:hypothetical protein
MLEFSDLTEQSARQLTQVQCQGTRRDARHLVPVTRPPRVGAGNPCFHGGSFLGVAAVTASLLSPRRPPTGSPTMAA